MVNEYPLWNMPAAVRPSGHEIAEEILRSEASYLVIVLRQYGWQVTERNRYLHAIRSACAMQASRHFAEINVAIKHGMPASIAI